MKKLNKDFINQTQKRLKKEMELKKTNKGDQLILSYCEEALNDYEFIFDLLLKIDTTENFEKVQSFIYMLENHKKDVNNMINQLNK
jgi:hypothetical protein